MRYILLCLFLVGCSNNENLEQLQVTALKEYLVENAILSDPIITKNVIGSDKQEYRGLVKFKIVGSNRTQTLKCYGITEDKETFIPLFYKQNLNIFCEP